MIPVGAKLKWHSHFGERTGKVVDHFFHAGKLIGYYVSPDDRAGQGTSYPLLVSFDMEPEEVS